jgi:hypothetical protein
MGVVGLREWRLSQRVSCTDWCARLPPLPRLVAAGLFPVLAGYGRLTGPLALITWWKATGGLFCTHLPPELAPMARMLSW